MSDELDTPEMKLLIKAIALAIEAGLAMGKSPEEIAVRLARDVGNALKEAVHD